MLTHVGMCILKNALPFGCRGHGTKNNEGIKRRGGGCWHGRGEKKSFCRLLHVVQVCVNTIQHLHISANTNVKGAVTTDISVFKSQ